MVGAYANGVVPFTALAALLEVADAVVPYGATRPVLPTDAGPGPPLMVVELRGMLNIGPAKVLTDAVDEKIKLRLELAEEVEIVAELSGQTVVLRVVRTVVKTVSGPPDTMVE